MLTGVGGQPEMRHPLRGDAPESFICINIYSRVQGGHFL